MRYGLQPGLVCHNRSALFDLADSDKVNINRVPLEDRGCGWTA
jgi:hypothetical protein